MKKILAICLLSLITFCAYSQYTYKIKTDSLLVTNDSCNAEFIIENSTRNINGFLYNRGNGRTEFAYAVDSVWIQNGQLFIRRGDGTTSLEVIGGGPTPTLQQVLTSGNASDLNISISGRAMFGGAVDDSVSTLQVEGHVVFDDSLNINGARIGFSRGVEGVYGTSENIWIGKEALLNRTATTRNVAIGERTLQNISTGYQNTSIGYYNLRNVGTGFRNTTIGASAMWAATNTSNNISIGHETMAFLASEGGRNIALGNHTLHQIRGYNNIGIGHAAGWSLKNVADSGNIIIGNDNNILRSISKWNVIIGGNVPNFPTTGITNNVIIADGKGNIKFRSAGDSTVLTTKFLNLQNFTPTGTSDSSGNVGDIAKDEDYFYIRTSSGWKRSAIFTTF